MATTDMYIQCKMEYDRYRRPEDKKFSTVMRSMFRRRQLVLVEKSEFDACSEIEQARHLQEDAVIRFLYIENKPG